MWHYVILEAHSSTLAFCPRCIPDFLRISCGCGTTIHIDTVHNMGQRILYAGNCCIVSGIMTATFLLCWGHLRKWSSEMNKKKNQLKTMKFSARGKIKNTIDSYNLHINLHYQHMADIIKTNESTGIPVQLYLIRVAIG